MKSTQGEWGFAGAVFAGFTHIVLNTIQGKPVTGKSLARSMVVGAINPFDSVSPFFGSWSPIGRGVSSIVFSNSLNNVLR
ncbi:MAG: hypothetical protein JKY19_00250 [Alcanivoracaceae bacterium]|nr:hypothetical protein [Alcanivoracaceae bacterium]